METQKSVEFELYKKYCFPGGKITGRIIVNGIIKSISSIKYMIIPEQYWEINHDKGLKAGFPTWHLLNKDFKPMSKKDSYAMFIEIPIPEFMLPCFEYYYKNNEAHVRYELVLMAMTSQDYNIERRFYIYILSKPHLSKDLQLFKEVKQSIKNFFFFDKGEITLKVFLPDFNFKYDSEYELLIDIDNTKGKLATDEYKVVVKRKLHFSEIIYFKQYDDEKEIIVIKEKAKVGVGEQKNFKCKIKFKDKENHKYNSNGYYYYKSLPSDFFMPTLDGDVIKCEYEIKVSLYFENFVDKSHRPRLIFPISLCHETLEEYMKRLGIKSIPNDLQSQNKTSSEITTETPTDSSTIYKGKNEGNNKVDSIEENKIEDIEENNNDNKNLNEEKKKEECNSILIDDDSKYPSKNEIDKNSNNTPNDKSGDNN